MTDTIVNEQNNSLDRTAMLQNGRLAELDIRDARGAAEGGVYLAKITDKIETAGGKSAYFLDIGDASGHDAFLNAEENGLGEASFTQGQSIVVQIQQEKRAEKGAKVIRALQFVGQYIVYCPFALGVSASSKIPDQAKADAYRKLAKENVVGNEGWILRTDSVTVEFDKIKEEMAELRKTYEEVRVRARTAKAPALLYSRENRLAEHIAKALPELKKIVVNNHNLEKELAEKFPSVKIEYIANPFEDFGLEDAIEDALQPEVPLSDGGRVSIEETRAFVAIDVDTGKNGGNGDVDKANEQAARVIAEQIRLRNLSGKIIVDFAGSSEYRFIKPVIEILKQEFAKDPVKTTVLGLSKAGNVEIMRVRRRPSLKDSLAE